MQAPPKSALTLELDWKVKPSLIVSGFKFHEPVNETITRRVQNILDCHHEDAQKFHETLKFYKQNIKPSFQCVETTYPRRGNNLGRSFVSSLEGKQNVAWTTMPRVLRNTLLNGLVYDFDLVNAQPSIMLQICLDAGWEAPQLQNMVTNRDDFLRIVSDEYEVSSADAKHLITSMMFGGSLDTWKHSLGIQKEDNPHMVQGCKHFVDEIKNLSGQLKLQNLPLFKVIKTLRTQSFGVEKKNELGSFLAHYLQHQEFIIVENAMIWMDQRGFFDYKAPNRKMVKAGSYEFDGFKLWSEVLDKKHVNPVTLCDELNLHIQNKFGPLISFAVKKLDSFLQIEGLDVDCIKRKRDDEEEEDERDLTTSEIALLPNPLLNEAYFAWKQNWEESLGWAKITNDAIFVYKHFENGKFHRLIQMNHKNLAIAYNHLKYVVETPKGTEEKNLIDTWIFHDPHIKRFSRIDSIPHDQLCPPDVFNLWVPYDMEYVTEWTHDEEYCQFWYNHFLILCGNDPIVCDYFLDFLGQMIMYPSQKPGVAIDFLSNEGAGKNTIFELCKLMFGNSKTFNCADPARDIWGHFNGQMRDAVFVLINELSKKDTLQAEGKIKDLITEPTFCLNEKGLKTIVLPSYHRFLSFQNPKNGDAGKRTTHGDRRNLMIRCSDELIGNKGYWDHVYNTQLKNMNGIKSFYEYLKARPRIHEFNRIPLPVTEYQENLKEANRSALESFLIDFVTHHHKKETMNISSSALFEAFNAWKTNNQVAYEVNKLTFGVRIKNLGIPGIERGRPTKIGETKILNIPILKKHFGIGCLVDIDEEAMENEVYEEPL